MKSDCQPVTLAQKSMIRVTRCRHCGCVSVDVGAFSVRINDEILEQFGDALTEAMTRLTFEKSGRVWSTQQSEPNDVH